MLFIYKYPDKHKLCKLNGHFLYFLTQIQQSKSKSKFVPSRYFDSDFFVIIERSPVLKEKFEYFFNSYKVMDESSRTSFHDAVLKCQKIEDFFGNQADCSPFKEETTTALIGNESLNELANYLFTVTLKSPEWDIAGHYEVIYKAMKYKICPFCGVEMMHQSFREDYDHLAAKSLYPLLCVHPRNLVPMCNTCNTKAKKGKDVLYTIDGKRRTMVYPYLKYIKVSFDYTSSIIPQTDKKNMSGKWVINISPNNASTKNWNYIFNIETRYIVDFLTPSFDDWINDFIDDCVDHGIDLTQINLMQNEFATFAMKFKEKWFKHSNIIKGPLFDFLSKCNNQVFYNSVVWKYNKKIKNVA